MEISFLLGAGFSVPDGYPSRRELNARLKKISKDELYIHTGGNAFITKDLNYPNHERMKLAERHFVEEFLDFYNTQILKDTDEFDYEVFYDYYQSILGGTNDCQKFSAFADEFRQKHSTEKINVSLLNQFNNTFNQLISQQVSRWPKRVHLSRYYPKYPSFLNFIDEIRNDYSKLHFHTLNHDLLLEELSHSDAFSGGISDGFEENGSNFYSNYNDYLTVRLSRFTNSFTGKFCLYKLHGSIDHYIYNFKNQEFTTVKVPYGVSRNELKREYTTEHGDIIYDKCFWNYFPDFLTGVESKTQHYYLKHYYQPVFNHFITNLRNSQYLTLIGYGLGDSEVNRIIKEEFLRDKSKRMLIITPNKPQSEFWDFDNVVYFGADLGVENINKEMVFKYLIG